MLPVTVDDVVEACVDDRRGDARSRAHHADL
jgi:hypothetical protein